MIPLYIHIPFCRSKCAYCSFYSISEDYKTEYIDSIIRCVKFYGGKKVKSVYLGGGTPSVLSAHDIGRLFDAVYQNFDVCADAEITVEANPESLSDEFLSAVKDCKVNRLSLGIQSLNDTELKAIGRLHNRQTALDAIERALKFGFENISCDLIFGLPFQTVESFYQNVTELSGLSIPHISCYNLQKEKGTPIYNTEVPDEEIQQKMYQTVCSVLSGYRHYEISNFCLDGYMARHNSAYWTGEDYLGLGPAAHSKLADYRYSFDADIKKFISKTDFGFDTKEKIDDAVFEQIMLGLRTDNGVPETLLKNSRAFCDMLIKEKLGYSKNGRFILTDKGYYLSNTIIAEITAREC